jgi:formamidopyrimidine-DNA glycosylase
MPELPEVETIVRNLRQGDGEHPPLTGHSIQKVELLWQRTLATPTPEDLNHTLPGRVIRGLWRRGKFIVIELDKDYLLIHLRMSGDLRLETSFDAKANPRPVEPHDRALFYFHNGWRLAFNDTRKFGRIWFVHDPAEVLGNLGPEPLEQTFTAEQFYRLLKDTHRQLKPLLLDQTFLAGLGNIYTDEALHIAGLHPQTRSNQLTEEQAKRLWYAIRQVLEEGIRHNGASIDWVYRGGNFQNHFRIYGRAGKPCLTCGTPIQRILISQRSTHFCPHCQPVSCATIK